MLLFIDESGHDHREMPCEVLAGVAVAEDNLWNLIQAIRAAERSRFGGHLRDLLIEETKARKLLKTKRFRIAGRDLELSDGECTVLANSLLRKGKEARAQGSDRAGETYAELVGYSRAVLRFVHDVLILAANHGVRVFASVVAADAPRPASGRLRKDYVYLFERYFYFLDVLPPRERGLVVFDELDKAQAHILIAQMGAYFLDTATGQHRSSRIVPEPFFVHSDLTTGVFLADLAAYILGWGWRSDHMAQPCREELSPFVSLLVDMAFHGQKPKPRWKGRGAWPLRGIVYLDDLRPKELGN